MRILVFFGLVFFGVLYGLAFDLLHASLAGGVICELLSVQLCPLPQRLDYWLSVCTFLLIAPIVLLYIIQWLVSRPWLVGSTTLVGLLLIAS